MMTDTVTYLRALIEELGENVRGDFAEGETFAFTYGGVTFTGRIYQRFNGHLVVAFESPVWSGMLGTAQRQWIAQVNGRYPFTTFQVVPTSESDAMVIATHSLLADSVEPLQLMEALDSLVHHTGEMKAKLEEMRDEMFAKVERVLREEGEKIRDGVDDLDEDEDADGDDDEDDVEHVEVLNDDDLIIVGSSRSKPAPTPTPKSTKTNTGATDEVLARLRQLVGLEPVKIEVERLVKSREFSNARVAKGLPAIEQSPHLVFTGNPGTGKTTVARLVAEVYKSLGILKKGHVVEADCSKLIAAYIGQTPIKTRRICEQARGGVLFIDEAYGLTSHQHQGYGPEAVETLLKFMEDNRGDIVVIVAGYPKEMQGFLDANPGLRSRFDVVIDFPDYSTPELTSIFDLYLDQYKLQLTPDARNRLVDFTVALPRGRGFGNGRAMRNLFNEVVRRQAVRVMGKPSHSPIDLIWVQPEDFPPVAAPVVSSRPGNYL
jgi:hypothetical protein